jgi:hypothetical protein
VCHLKLALLVREKKGDLDSLIAFPPVILWKPEIFDYYLLQHLVGNY